MKRWRSEVANVLFFRVFIFHTNVLIMKLLKFLFRTLIIPSLLFVVGCSTCCREAVVAPPPPPPPAPVVPVSTELGDVFFAFDSALLNTVSESQLNENVQWMNDNPEASVVIEGHCDERGTDEYNIALGERRAETAKNYMTNAGVDPSRMQTVSYGEERPFDPGHDEDAWAKNRRAHFVAK